MTELQVDQLLEKLDRIASSLEVLIRGSLQGQADATEQMLNEQRETASKLSEKESQ